MLGLGSSERIIAVVLTILGMNPNVRYTLVIHRPNEITHAATLCTPRCSVACTCRRRRRPASGSDRRMACRETRGEDQDRPLRGQTLGLPVVGSGARNRQQ